MDSKVRFTLKGREQETTFSLVEVADGFLLHTTVDGEELKIPLLLENKILTFKDVSEFDRFEEEKNLVEDRLIGLTEEMIDASSSGLEFSEDNGSFLEEKPSYGPDDIYVENKPFSLKQIVDLIEDGDIELTPDFQRNFVWDRTRQSRLIESIFLGLPLPAIYLSQYDDGTLTIVDGLQRLTTIKRFMDDKLVLSNLEYLKTCNGKKKSEVTETLSPLRIRRFGQTQIMCFVIDYRSPHELKFDLFRRLNTGGKPLNNQEIRNCLSKPKLQKALHIMTNTAAFMNATGKSLRKTRMVDQESALRFMYFYDQYSQDNPIGDYNGKMDSTLDAYVNELNKEDNFQAYMDAYEECLEIAYELFGDFTFRKVYTDYDETSKNPINKLLMLVITVLLAQDEYKMLHDDCEVGVLVEPLAKLIEEDEVFFNAITWGTNNSRNISLAFKTIREKLFDSYNK